MADQDDEPLSENDPAAERMLQDARETILKAACEMAADANTLRRLLREQIARVESSLSQSQDSLMRAVTSELQAAVIRAKQVPGNRAGQVIRALPDGRDAAYLRKWVAEFCQSPDNNGEALDEAVDWLFSNQEAIHKVLNATVSRLEQTDGPEAKELLARLKGAS